MTNELQVITIVSYDNIQNSFSFRHKCKLINYNIISNLVPTFIDYGV